ncbi:O-antigen ligase family protein [Deinococcus petrolearius]|uniref:O-antigen ligase family protein n=1 Tax=Deinococcus petrolearius TaxID=1751295 RepID=A0ABW1DLW1_9DEIO
MMPSLWNAPRAGLAGRIPPEPWLWAAALGGALLTGLLVAPQPALAVAGALLPFLLAGALGLRAALPRWSLLLLGGCLLGYALLGRGFAYIGAPPLYIGELTLLACGGAALLAARVRGLLGSPLGTLLLLYLLIGAAATLPWVGRYGLDALRDAALWGYGLFALAVAALLLRGGWVLEAARQYVRFVPVFLYCVPVLVLLSKLNPGLLPRLPGADAPLGDLKGGDVAVHLAGIAALLLLGLPALLGGGRAAPGAELPGAGGAGASRREWSWWTLWLAAAAIPVFRVRAGLLAIAAAVFVVVALRPGSRWGKPAALLTLALTLMLTLGGAVTLGEQRNTISPQALLLNVQSIAGGSGEGYRDGTRTWRLRWWGDIVNYTVHGPYFWTGKGYGVNLADADGYQLDDGALRSPHNGHMTILARSGVPGLLAWALLQLTFALSLLRAYRRAARAGQALWARLNLWVLAYWTAFMVNTTFDVYLEGPQGGIWFWCLFGFGLALLLAQRGLGREGSRPA